MKCPGCGHSTESGHARCPECGLDLTTPGRPVEVLATQDPTLIPVVRSLLDLAEIPYEIRGDHSFSLQPAFDLLTGRESTPIRVFVPEELAEEARALLEPDEPDES